MAKGYTRISNDLISGLAMSDLTSTEFRVLLAIIRNTICFHRNQHEISNGFLANATGMCERSIIRGIQGLAKKKIIKIVSKSNGTHPRIIRLSTDNLVTLTSCQGGTDKPVSDSTDNPVSSSTDKPVTQEKKEINNIKEQERKEISSFSEDDGEWLDPEEILKEMEKEKDGAV